MSKRIKEMPCSNFSVCTYLIFAEEMLDRKYKKLHFYWIKNTQHRKKVMVVQKEEQGLHCHTDISFWQRRPQWQSWYHKREKTSTHVIQFFSLYESKRLRAFFLTRTTIYWWGRDDKAQSKAKKINEMWVVKMCFFCFLLLVLFQKLHSPTKHLIALGSNSQKRFEITPHYPQADLTYWYYTIWLGLYFSLPTFSIPQRMRATHEGQAYFKPWHLLGLIVIY